MISPYHAGVYAFRNGIEYVDCPYDYGTSDYEDWTDGWLEEEMRYDK